MSLPAGIQKGRRQRLLLGVTPLDALSGGPPVASLRFEIERGLPHRSPPSDTPACLPQSYDRLPKALCRHNSGRFALLYHPGLTSHVDLRIDDFRRCYVPRRLRVPLMSLTEIEAAEAAGQGADLTRRSRAPVMFPGAAYPLLSKATGLRGRVLRGGEPMRWAMIEAVLPNSDPEDVLVLARGDDRGEFLLLLPPRAAAGAELPAQIQLRIEVSGPSTAPEPSDSSQRGLDPLWDLPQDTWEEHQFPDPIANAIQVPDDYRRSSVSRTVDFEPGRVLTGADEDAFTFS